MATAMEPSLLSDKDIKPSDRLIYALDHPSHEEALDMIATLGDSVNFYKLGLELFMAGDYFYFVEQLVNKGKHVFVDLKFFDVPETVGAAVAQVKNLGAEFVTVHGNGAMMKAAIAEKGTAVKILAVTVLTSLDRFDLQEMGFEIDVPDLVLQRAKRALEYGCDGVISSGLEAQRIREELGQRLLIVSPGIRPVDNDVFGPIVDDDQKRKATAEEAFHAGADYIVVGRPIKLASDPKAAAEVFRQTIADIFPGG